MNLFREEKCVRSHGCRVIGIEGFEASGLCPEFSAGVAASAAGMICRSGITERVPMRPQSPRRPNQLLKFQRLNGHPTQGSNPRKEKNPKDISERAFDSINMSKPLRAMAGQEHGHWCTSS